MKTFLLLSALLSCLFSGSARGGNPKPEIASQWNGAKVAFLKHNYSAILPASKAAART